MLASAIPCGSFPEANQSVKLNRNNYSTPLKINMEPTVIMEVWKPGCIQKGHSTLGTRKKVKGEVKTAA